MYTSIHADSVVNYVPMRLELSNVFTNYITHQVVGCPWSFSAVGFSARWIFIWLLMYVSIFRYNNGEPAQTQLIFSYCQKWRVVFSTHRDTTVCDCAQLKNSNTETHRRGVQCFIAHTLISEFAEKNVTFCLSGNWRTHVANIPAVRQFQNRCRLVSLKTRVPAFGFRLDLS